LLVGFVDRVTTVLYSDV